MSSLRQTFFLNCKKARIDMIKILFYVDIAFFYRKANIQHRWSNILRISNRSKGLYDCCKIQWFGSKLALLHSAFEQSLYLDLCCVSVQDSHGCSVTQNMNTQLFSFFCRLTTCTCWTAQWHGHSDMVIVDADWHRLKLLTDSRSSSLETQTQIWNWLRQLPHCTQVIHCLLTVHCWLLLMRQRWQDSCIFSSRLMMTLCSRSAYEISRNCLIRTASTFLCRHWRLYLSQTQNYQRMHITFEYALKMGAEGLFCSSKLQVK